ncbi:MAG: hypothetical protein AUG54_03290 [Ktedonobacter sp. 13_1_20CM_4_53_7]|nr:MAG: hypothetical protein AUG54_03290 [Ktedonobacter sp. 13_1_20CM_4_53_7]
MMKMKNWRIVLARLPLAQCNVRHSYCKISHLKLEGYHIEDRYGLMNSLPILQFNLMDDNK